MSHPSLLSRLQLVRSRLEREFSERQYDASLKTSQHMDVMIHHVFLIRQGNFSRHQPACRGYKVSEAKDARKKHRENPWQRAE